MRFSNRMTVDPTCGRQHLRLVGDLEELQSLPFDSLSHNSRAALEAVEDVSRRIEDLATQLGCLGFFDQGDGPRAA